MRSPSFVLGYHGCDRAVGENILSGSEHLRTSENDYDWLGSGIYFWENSAARAIEWAHAASKNPRISKARIRVPFVVGAIIDLGNCLDLLESESIRIVESAHDRLVEACANAGVSCPKNHEVNGELMVRQLVARSSTTHMSSGKARASRHLILSALHFSKGHGSTPMPDFRGRRTYRFVSGGTSPSGGISARSISPEHSGIPAILREGGYSVMIFTRESDEPAHVHVLKDRRIAKFWLAELEPARNSGYRPHEIEEIRRIIKKHRVQLVKSYEKFHGTK